MKRTVNFFGIVAIFLLATGTASAQNTNNYSLKYSYYNSFGDEIGFVDQKNDTLLMSKSGQGHKNELSGYFFFEDNTPGIHFGISAGFRNRELGRFQADLIGGSLDYRTISGQDYALGLLLKLDDKLDVISSGRSKFTLGASLLYQKYNMNWLSREGIGTLYPLSIEYKRFGAGLNLSGIIARDEYLRWFPKADISANVSYFLRDIAEDISGTRLAYAGEINLNLVRALEFKKMYISPVIGASIEEMREIPLGCSPFISVGASLSLSDYRADILKIYYQKRIIRGFTPKYNLDGVFFSVDIGAFFHLFHK